MSSEGKDQVTQDQIQKLRLEKCMKCNSLCTWRGSYFCAYNETPDICGEHFHRKGEWQGGDRDKEPVY
jgi:hypothetical protein